MKMITTLNLIMIVSLETFNTDNSTDTKKAIISDLNIFVLKKDNTATFKNISYNGEDSNSIRFPNDQNGNNVTARRVLGTNIKDIYLSRQISYNESDDSPYKFFIFMQLLTSIINYIYLVL